MAAESNISNNYEFVDGSGTGSSGSTSAAPTTFVTKSTAYENKRTLLGLSDDTWKTYVEAYPYWAKKNGEIHQISSTNAIVSSGLVKDFLYAGLPATALSKAIAFGTSSSSTAPVYNKTTFDSTPFNPWVKQAPTITTLGGTVLNSYGEAAQSFYKYRKQAVPVPRMVRPGTFPTFTNTLCSITSRRSSTIPKLYYMTWDYPNNTLKVLEFDADSSNYQFAFQRYLVSPLTPSDISSDLGTDFNTDGYYRKEHDYNFLIELQASGGSGGIRHNNYGGDGGGSGGYACFVVNTRQFYTSSEYQATRGYGRGLLILDFAGYYLVGYKFDETKSFLDSSASDLLVSFLVPSSSNYGKDLGLGLVATIKAGDDATSANTGGKYGSGGSITLYHHNSEDYSSSNNKVFTKVLAGGDSTPATSGETWYCDGHVKDDVATYGTFPFLNTTGDENTDKKFSDYPMYLVAAIAGGSGGQTGTSASSAGSKYGADCTQTTYLIDYDIASSTTYQTQLGGVVTNTAAYIKRNTFGGIVGYAGQSGGNGAASVLGNGGIGGRQTAAEAGQAGGIGAGAGGNSEACSDQTAKLGGSGRIKIWY